MAKSRKQEEAALEFTQRELDVMAVLWTRASATVAEVRDELPDRLAYTTVLTVLRTLERKGYATHESDGKAHRFQAAVDRDVAGRSLLRRIKDTVFAGSVALLVTNLVSDRKLTSAELRRLQQAVDRRLKHRA